MKEDIPGNEFVTSFSVIGVRKTQARGLAVGEADQTFPCAVASAVEI